jgi:hypothetical protein
MITSWVLDYNRLETLNVSHYMKHYIAHLVQKIISERYFYRSRIFPYLTFCRAIGILS